MWAQTNFWSQCAILIKAKKRGNKLKRLKTKKFKENLTDKNVYRMALWKRNVKTGQEKGRTKEDENS